MAIKKHAPAFHTENTEDENYPWYHLNSPQLHSYGLSECQSTLLFYDGNSRCSLLEFLDPFGALLAGCIQPKSFHCLAPPDNSLKVLLWPTCSCSNALWAYYSTLKRCNFLSLVFYSCFPACKCKKPVTHLVPQALLSYVRILSRNFFNKESKTSAFPFASR